ncbi:MAG: pantoate--beta-alanine ligase [Chloroflexi bacterium]|nr:pantoate--beta-alanine ligase [Chloroflexota bacterium]
MRVVESIAEARAAPREAARPLGLVPTMGYLHDGHLSLARRAREDNATVVASIFVNPTQFGPAEDFGSYPRDLERDLRLLRDAGVDLVFTPALAEIYPPGHDTTVVVGAVAERLEGAARPGHFRGVTTVVAKLFNIFQPDRAYFGQKDAQQVAVIRRMARDLDFPVAIEALPTVREPDGLAMSSRNVYLAPDERQAAVVLWRSLQAVEALYRDGERSGNRLRDAMRRLLDAEPLAQTDYVSVADPATLDELTRLDGPALVSLAVRIGRTRLIDNITLGTRQVG